MSDDEDSMYRINVVSHGYRPIERMGKVVACEVTITLRTIVTAEDSRNAMGIFDVAVMPQPIRKGPRGCTCTHPYAEHFDRDSTSTQCAHPFCRCTRYWPVEEPQSPQRPSRSARARG